MNTPPDKPPTRESVEAAKRFAASLPALPQPQEKKPKCPKCDLSYYVEDGKCNRCKTTGIGKPTDYERGFEQGYHEGYSTGYQAGLRKAASHV